MDGGHAGNAGAIPVRHEHTPFNDTLLINELVIK